MEFNLQNKVYLYYSFHLHKNAPINMKDRLINERILYYLQISQNDKNKYNLFI